MTAKCPQCGGLYGPLANDLLIHLKNTHQLTVEYYDASIGCFKLVGWLPGTLEQRFERNILEDRVRYHVGRLLDWLSGLKEPPLYDQGEIRFTHSEWHNTIDALHRFANPGRSARCPSCGAKISND